MVSVMNYEKNQTKDIHAFSLHTNGATQSCIVKCNSASFIEGVVNRNFKIFENLNQSYYKVKVSGLTVLVIVHVRTELRNPNGDHCDLEIGD